uniref:CCHC-type domain-containing protein n=1 Tax=Cajanus cajan TaxID=3821 RepID=A0A151U0D1_CAJCA|nr:hypothetical protein KK1_005321 [Cajanus cajan]
MLNSKARNALMCALIEEEYTKVHSFRSAKQMWDTLAITYEGSLEVKCNKLSLLVHKYELFEVEENESIQTMFGRFQTIVNELSFLGRTYDNFDHNDKLLRSLPRKWRPQVMALRASKDLEKLSQDKLVGLLKVHEMELHQDEEVYCTEKIYSMMKKEGGSRWRKSNRTPREKAQPLCYECKKPGHYKTECPELGKEREKEKKKSTPHKKKAMMLTWEDLDTTSSEDDEQANICLMADIDSSSESDDEEVSKSDFKDLQHAYYLKGIANLGIDSNEDEKYNLKVWECSNKLSLMFMRMTIANNIKTTIPQTKSAREYLESVEERFCSVDKSLAGTLMVQLTTIKFDGLRSMQEHTIEMTNIAARLKSLGMVVDDSFMVQFILNSLPSETYDSRTIRGYFIGYPEKSKGYIFYCPNHSPRIMETGNIKFLENGEVSGSKEQKNIDII